MTNHVLGFMNAYTQGISGGDQEFVNHIRRSSDKFTVVTSYLGQKLCRDHGLKPKYIITSKEPVFRHPVLIYFFRTLSAVINTLYLRPDHILSSSDFIPDVIPAFLIKLFNPRTFWLQKIYHLIPPHRRISSFFQKLSFLFIKMADRIEVDNSDLRNNLINIYNFSPSRVIIVPLFVDRDAIVAVRPSPRHFTAVFFGQLRQSKGIFDLIAVWSRIVLLYPNATLAYIGSDLNGNRFQLEKLAFKFKKNIIFLGSLPTLKACSYIKSAGFVVIPSSEEGFGLAVRESLVCRRPVIVYDLPAFKDIDDPFLIRIPLKDTETLYSSIIKLLP